MIQAPPLTWKLAGRIFPKSRPEVTDFNNDALLHKQKNVDEWEVCRTSYQSFFFTISHLFSYLVVFDLYIETLMQIPKDLALYPVILWDLLLRYSTSSTVHTAPFTFSTRTKHLCRLRLWRTAFWCRPGQRWDHSQRTLLLRRVNHRDDWYLPSGSVASEISKRPCEPGVDLVEGELPVWRFHNGLNEGNWMTIVILIIIDIVFSF